MKDSTTNIFGTVKQKDFRRKNLTPLASPSVKKNFPTLENFWTTAQNDSLTKCSRTVIQNNFDKKWWFPTPSFTPKTFRDTKIVKHERIPQRIFSAVWDKKISTENRDNPPPPSYPQNFSIPENFRNTKAFFNEMFPYCETKQFRRKIVMLAASLILKIFRPLNFSEPQQRRVPLWNGSVLWEKTISIENRDSRRPLSSLTFFDTRN